MASLPLKRNRNSAHDLSSFFFLSLERNKSEHRETSTIDERCQKQMLNELDIVMRENTCPDIVLFYGALFKEVDERVILDSI
jgi:hypothetical protein